MLFAVLVYIPVPILLLEGTNTLGRLQWRKRFRLFLFANTTYTIPSFLYDAWYMWNVRIDDNYKVILSLYDVPVLDYLLQQELFISIMLWILITGDERKVDG